MRDRFDIVKGNEIDISPQNWDYLNNVYDRDEIKQMISDAIRDNDIPMPRRYLRKMLIKISMIFYLFSQRKLLPKLLGVLDMSMILNIFSWIKYLDARTRAIKLQTTFSVTGGCAIV